MWEKFGTQVRCMLFGMRHNVATAALTAFAVLAPISLCAQQSENWGKLLNSKQYDQAQALCESWTKETSLDKRVEAEKCLANVELARGERLELNGNDTGGGALGEGWSREAVDKALAHLNKGIQLAP